MTKTPTRAPAAPDKLAAAQAVYDAAEANETAAEQKLAEFRRRRSELTSDITRQKAALTAKGDAMAAKPNADTKAAFRAATTDLAALEAQEKALAERFIPPAMNDFEDAREACRAADVILDRESLRHSIRTELLPVDQRFIDAMETATKALNESLVARRKLAADHGHNEGFGAGFLYCAVPMDFRRWVHAYTNSSAAPDLIAAITARFDLDGDYDDYGAVQTSPTVAPTPPRTVTITREGEDIDLAPQRQTGKTTSVVPEPIDRGRGVSITTVEGA